MALGLGLGLFRTRRPKRRRRATGIGRVQHRRSNRRPSAELRGEVIADGPTQKVRGCKARNTVENRDTARKNTGPHAFKPVFFVTRIFFLASNAFQSPFSQLFIKFIHQKGRLQSSSNALWTCCPKSFFTPKQGNPKVGVGTWDVRT